MKSTLAIAAIALLCSALCCLAVETTEHRANAEGHESERRPEAVGAPEPESADDKAVEKHADNGAELPGLRDGEAPPPAPPPTPKSEPPAGPATFDQFKTQWGRKYDSLVEELRRQKLFLARYLRSKVSWVKFYAGKAKSFLNINRMSDWDEKDRERMKNKLATEEERAKLATHKAEAGQSRAERRKRAAHDSDDDDDDDDRDSPLKKIGLGVSKRLSGILKRKNQPAYDRKSNGYDLRSTGCFHAPQHQGQCGSCYALASIAMYEYLYCRLNENQKIKFSEQYVLDCGHKQLSNLRMEGCNGGTMDAVTEFSHSMGFERSAEWPYVAHDNNKCPYVKPGTGRLNKKAAGYMKFHSTGLTEVPAEKFEKYLSKKIPIYVSIWTNDDTFLEYGGGVDSGERCQGGDTHAVLLVGSGVQDGAEYWLFRNTYGPDWGEAGHYKLNKRSNCIANDEIGYTLDAFKRSDRKGFKLNKYYQGIPGKTRHEEEKEDSDDDGTERYDYGWFGGKSKKKKKKSDKKGGGGDDGPPPFVGMYHLTHYDDEPHYMGPSEPIYENQHYEQHIDRDYYNKVNNYVDNYFHYDPDANKPPPGPKYVEQEHFEPYDWENGKFNLFAGLGRFYPPNGGR